MRYPLMRNNILREDLDKVIKHLSIDDPILTNGPIIREFESLWSEWLGVKHSVFLNSGASSNLLSISILKLKFPEGGEVIVPPLTWISDVSSVIQNGFTPIFADINPSTLGMCDEEIIKKITSKTKAVFLSHIQGFNALTEKLILKLHESNIYLIEDVCESHGATHNGKKAGSIGWISNFSFYYAHHMSTIEGGMLCTNDSNVYEQARLLRSHGMLRESQDEEYKKDIISNNPDLNPDFIFMYPAYNLRNTEIGGILGISQLNRLDNIVLKRTENLKHFLSVIDSTIYQTNFHVEGSSNYAFNLILRDADEVKVEKLMKLMKDNEIEFRRGSAGGGNQLRQPYLKSMIPLNHHQEFKNTEHIHFYGFYIGNYPDLTFKEIDQIAIVLNQL
jgi:CDP-4-dehydro-6-deoxyglucose reductase, E1